MLLSLDAVVRTLVRRLVTRRRLLEWETAAETEFSTRKRTPVDIYLDWMPALALGVGRAGVLRAPSRFLRRPAHPAALGLQQVDFDVVEPASATPRTTETSDKDELFLSSAALRTWRYFAEFSTAEHNWLIPDNVQEEPAAIAAPYFAHQPGLSS